MRQPDVDPHGLSDAPERRRRRRLPYIVVGVVLAALILFVWLRDRQPAQWENQQYGISLEFQNRFRNEGSDDLGPAPTGTVFRNGWLVRGNPGWDEEEWEVVAYLGLPLYFNGFIVSVVEPPDGVCAECPPNEITLGDDWPPAAAAASAGPVPATVGGRPALRYSLDREHERRPVAARDVAGPGGRPLVRGAPAGARERLGRGVPVADRGSALAAHRCGRRRLLSRRRRGPAAPPRIAPAPAIPPPSGRIGPPRGALRPRVPARSS